MWKFGVQQGTAWSERTDVAPKSKQFNFPFLSFIGSITTYFFFQ